MHYCNKCKFFFQLKCAFNMPDLIMCNSNFSETKFRSVSVVEAVTSFGMAKIHKIKNQS